MTDTDTDISDLPTPGTEPDISDLPTPNAPAMRTAATEYYGPDPNEPDQMVDPQTMKMVTVPRWKAAGNSSPEEFVEGHKAGTNFVAGVGKQAMGTLSGIHQIALHIGNHLGLVPDEDIQKNQADIDEQRQIDKPLMNTTAGRAGVAAGAAGEMAMLPVTGIMGSAAVGGLLGAAEPVATGESRGATALKGALGGAGGAAVGKVAGAVLKGFGGTGARQAAIDTLDSAAKAAGVGEKFPLDVAQRTGSKAAQTVVRASGMTSDASSEFAAQQIPAYNRIVLHQMGVKSPTATAATPDVLDPARRAIQGTMNRVAANTKTKLDQTLLNDMVDIEDAAKQTLPTSDAEPIHTNLKNIINNAAANGGYLDGTFYQKINSNLGALSRNPTTSPIAKDLKEALDDAVHRYAAPQDVKDLETARKQYRAMKQIEPAIDPATGNISPSKLITSMATKSNRNQALYGRGDQGLMNIARAGKQLIPDTLGNSGTAERALPILGALETLGSGEPGKAATKLAVGTMGLNAAGRAMRSQGRVGDYLAKGMGPAGQIAGSAVKRAAPPIGTGTALSEPSDSQPVQRAAGGKVDHEALVQRLINRWKYAKRATDQTTKPLLSAHDDVIARALHIAGRSI